MLPRKILIADDDVTSCLLLMKMAEGYGLTCHLVHNGADAARAAVDNEYLVVFMDLFMPIVSGFDATIKIKSTTSKPPLIVGLLSFDEDNMRSKCLKAGMSDVMIKPFNREIVRKMIDYASLTAIETANGTRLSDSDCFTGDDDYPRPQQAFCCTGEDDHTRPDQGMKKEALFNIMRTIRVQNHVHPSMHG